MQRATEIVIDYGGLRVEVDEAAMQEARDWVKAQHPESRTWIMDSVDTEIQKKLPKLMAGNASRRVTEGFCMDLLYWQALKERAV